MIGSPPFPISVDQLTTTELSAALGVPVVDFVAERIGADRGMLGDIFRIVPTYDAGSVGPPAVVAKFAALRDGALASARRGGTHERELRCYDELLADTDVTTPHFYGAWYDPETAHFLLIQEAIESDRSIDQVAGLDIPLVQLVLSEAARMHHRWWKQPVLDRLDWLPRLDGDKRRTNLAIIAERGWQPLCDLLGDEFSAADRALGPGFPARLDACLVEASTYDTTLLHSDLRADNLLFSPDRSEVALIDWQGVSIGPGGFDIAYLLSHSLTVESRRQHEDELLDFYRAELARCGTQIDPAALRSSYVTSLPYGLVIACALPLVADAGQPRVRALATAMARRTIEALRDHGQLWED